MPLNHAVLWLDHHSAQVLRFDAEHIHQEKVNEHVHHTRQHGSQVRTEHEFFAHVCDALAGIRAVMVAGSHKVQADFRHYVEKHRPKVMLQIAGWETIDHPTEGELVKMARKFFVDQGEMIATPRIS